MTTTLTAPRRYAYVQAYRDTDGDGELIAFRHTFVQAASDEDAYDAGYKALGSPYPGLLNDYVIPLQEEPAHADMGCQEQGKDPLPQRPPVR